MPPLVELLALGLALLWALIVAYTAWRLTHPPRRTYASAIAAGVPGDPSELDEPLPYETWTLSGPAGAVEVWDIAGLDPRGPALVMVHGWGDGRIGALARAPALAPYCSRLIAFDLPAQGERGGWLRMGAREHAEVLALVERVGSPTVLFGWSLGAGVCLAAAAEDGTGLVRGVIAEAVYRRVRTPARNVLHQAGLPWRATLDPALWLLGTLAGRGPGWRGFDRAAIAARVRTPVLLLHGDEDPISPIEDARAVAAAAPDARLVTLEGGSHNDLWLEPHAAAAARACADLLRGVRTPG